MIGLEKYHMEKCHIYIIQVRGISLQRTTKLLGRVFLIIYQVYGQTSRADRINELIEEKASVDIEDMKSIQLDLNQTLH